MIKNLVRKRRFCVNTPIGFYKIFSASRFSNAFNYCNSSNLSCPPWDSFIIPSSRFFLRNSFFSAIIIQKLPQGITPAPEEFEKILYRTYDLTYQYANYSNNLILWERAFQQKIWSYIDNNLISKIKKNMENLYLPLTGSHGDFNPKNILIDSKQHRWLFDWDMFNPNDSFIQDFYMAIGRRIFGIRNFNMSQYNFDLFKIEYDKKNADKKLSYINSLLIFSLMMLQSNNLIYDQQKFRQRVRDCNNLIKMIL